MHKWDAKLSPTIFHPSRLSNSISSRSKTRKTFLANAAHHSARQVQPKFSSLIYDKNIFQSTCNFTHSTNANSKTADSKSFLPSRKIEDFQPKTRPRQHLDNFERFLWRDKTFISEARRGKRFLCRHFRGKHLIRKSSFGARKIQFDLIASIRREFFTDFRSNCIFTGKIRAVKTTRAGFGCLNFTKAEAKLWQIRFFLPTNSSLNSLKRHETDTLNRSCCHSWTRFTDASFQFLDARGTRAIPSSVRRPFALSTPSPERLPKDCSEIYLAIIVFVSIPRFFIKSKPDKSVCTSARSARQFMAEHVSTVTWCFCRVTRLLFNDFEVYKLIT